MHIKYYCSHLPCMLLVIVVSYYSYCFLQFHEFVSHLSEVLGIHHTFAGLGICGAVWVYTYM